MLSRKLWSGAIVLAAYGVVHATAREARAAEKGIVSTAVETGSFKRLVGATGYVWGAAVVAATTASDPSELAALPIDHSVPSVQTAGCLRESKAKRSITLQLSTADGLEPYPTRACKVRSYLIMVIGLGI